MSTQFRQGDLLFEVVAKLPKDLVQVFPESDGRLIVAEGEATGHHHAIVGEDTALFTVDPDSDDSDRYITTSKLIALLEHDEHETLTLPEESVIKVSRQREYEVEGGVATSRRVYD